MSPLPRTNVSLTTFTTTIGVTKRLPCMSACRVRPTRGPTPTRAVQDRAYGGRRRRYQESIPFEEPLELECVRKRDNFGGGGSEKETPTLVKDSKRRQRARLKSVKKISQSQARHTESTPVWLSRASVIGLQVQQPAEVEAHNYMSATKLPNIP